jgi:AMP nucleosidase
MSIRAWPIGHVVAPGRYTATITRPDLFGHYLETQIA